MDDGISLTPSALRITAQRCTDKRERNRGYVGLANENEIQPQRGCVFLRNPVGVELLGRC